ncbi:hypothetical protein GYMLUDRAFT_635676 [Collybiopsis luxurians FD-317 M1]|nr:hypothetical protein GYMLUDRAFT_635676 [Collybiopsis luxurians FD-317 M1]
MRLLIPKRTKPCPLLREINRRNRRNGLALSVFLPGRAAFLLFPLELVGNRVYVDLA